MHYIVLDLEATCWERRDQSPNEIIEIGAVCINNKGQAVDEFVTFVRPKVHPQLSDFCTQLTSITQARVDAAPRFPEALEAFQDWIASFDSDYWLCSWGFYDRSQFEKDCRLYGLPTDWLEQHISLKHQYGDIKNMRPPGMQGALKLENMRLDGTHHRGIDDARNIAKIFMKFFDQWVFKSTRR